MNLKRSLNTNALKAPLGAIESHFSLDMDFSLCIRLVPSNFGYYNDFMVYFSPKRFQEMARNYTSGVEYLFPKSIGMEKNMIADCTKFILHGVSGVPILV